MKQRGKWWFHNDPDRIFYGYFTFDESGIHLEILDNPFPNQLEKVDIILGILEDEQKITLAECTLRKSYPFLNSFQICRFYASFAFLGTHFNHLNDIRFRSIVVKYSNIESFISHYFLTYDPIKKDGDTYKNYEALREIDVPDICRLRIYPESKKIESDLLFEFSSYSEKSVYRYIELKGIFLDFLNFVISKEVFVESFYGTLEEGFRSKIKILYRSTRRKPIYPDQKVMFKPTVTSLLLHYVDISAEFQSILSKWFRISETLKHVYDLYFGVIYSIDQYDVYRFLMLTTAAEVYHGLKMRKDALFKQRIKELYQLFPKEVSIILATKNMDEAAKDVEETRHYYTHYDPKREPNAAKDEKLYWLTKDLQVVLQMCLLKELGFGEDRIEKIYHLDKGH